ncbi:unnamed protein product [Musa hybrid cultivar]
MKWKNEHRSNKILNRLHQGSSFPAITLSRMQAEKEERRLPRVLADRESARQTILRRQALRKELKRRVADLSLQNENMKMEKDLAAKEYLSLKGANEHLKEQV